MKGLVLNRIPGYAEALKRARARQSRARENAWKNLSTRVFDFTVRPMTVRDYVILDHYGSPFIFRRVPELCDVAFFLWLMSSQCGWWNDAKGWRRPWLGKLRSLQAFFFTRRVEKYFDTHPEGFEGAVKQLFDYIENTFMDSPPSVQKDIPTATSFLTIWFDAMQSEYRLTEDEVWRMPLPQLFQRLVAMGQRKGVARPQFNNVEDQLKAWVQEGLGNGRFTMEDLAEGKVKFSEN